ncbi:gliding motility lipoprotein GldH [Prevotella scopos JCM 17725]|uniref:Gliding motility-associated lipoprotein GldH n=1 Tax=Prevotella scopos JCM 17725 TaxID=1236518 RepID=A0AAX2F2D7_9BACT|nr:gliding motility lipoprotein GldH [Prevotella scopos]ANR73220.1 gliding motility protein GldH [Prevotella scopos JCM 17725]QUB45955.1 gliding motility lipoprotein GldH [Prevotella scopos JCM 17725]SHF63311.1 gliding motility-associated lipoprotein GldH [Prevotella scopos JCM 17725]
MKHKVSTLFYIIALMTTIMSATSCSDPRTYDQYKSVSLQGWQRNDTLTFDIPRQWEGNYQLDLCLRAAQTYPYRNLSVIIERKLIYFRQRKKLEKTYNDTVNCEVINVKGTLVGHKGITSTEILQAVTSFRLNRNDSLQVKIHHIMNRESLPGISDVGIRLLKNKHDQKH